MSFRGRGFHCLCFKFCVLHNFRRTTSDAGEHSLELLFLGSEARPYVYTSPQCTVTMEGSSYVCVSVRVCWLHFTASPLSCDCRCGTWGPPTSVRERWKVTQVSSWPSAPTATNSSAALRTATSL